MLYEIENLIPKGFYIMKLYNVFYDEKYPEDGNLSVAEICFYCLNPEVPAAEAEYISDLTEEQAEELIERLSHIYPSFFYYKKEVEVA